jgi:hypothetical protein
VAFSAQFRGAPAAAQRLALIRETAARLSRQTVSVGTVKPYAYGIETGRKYHSGRLARRAGGAFMLAGGLEEARPRIGPLYLAAILRGRPSETGLVLGNVGRMVQTAIRRLTPVGRRPNSSRLRDSYTVGIR